MHSFSKVKLTKENYCSLGCVIDKFLWQCTHTTNQGGSAIYKQVPRDAPYPSGTPLPPAHVLYVIHSPLFVACLHFKFFDLILFCTCWDTFDDPTEPRLRLGH